MENLVTTNSIIQWLKEQVEQKKPVSPTQWLEASQRLCILLGDESEELFKLQQKVAQQKVDYIEQDKSVSEAKARVEASDDYRLYCCQKAKIARIDEQIRIAKIQSRTVMEEFRGQNIH